jgi:signal transduction histidine kinase
MELLASVSEGGVAAGEAYMAEDPALSATGYRLIAEPLRRTDGEIFGGVVMGWGVSGSVPLPAISEVSAAADTFALLAEIPGYLKDLEFRAVMGERNRFAREIHDGLAQSLGYLKLLAARMAGYLAAGDLARLTASLAEIRAALGATYEDARSAIDDLVLSPDSGLRDWLERMAADFEGTTGIPVTLSGEDSADEPPAEVQAQIIRILQEALTNVRKHASAAHVWIGWYSRSGVLTLEVRDDGGGFRPDLLLGSSQHGLLSMQERAELIGGKLQIVSSDGEGTIVRLRLMQEVPESET